jgi:TPP-dependent indolepyruvate ferredoxin oxidoreductase alpha subunit
MERRCSFCDRLEGELAELFVRDLHDRAPAICDGCVEQASQIMIANAIAARARDGVHCEPRGKR